MNHTKIFLPTAKWKSLQLFITKIGAFPFESLPARASKSRNSGLATRSKNRPAGPGKMAGSGQRNFNDEKMTKSFHKVDQNGAEQTRSRSGHFWTP